jgi:hypothetical protein
MVSPPMVSDTQCSTYLNYARDHYIDDDVHKIADTDWAWSIARSRSSRMLMPRFLASFGSSTIIIMQSMDHNKLSLSLPAEPYGFHGVANGHSAVMLDLRTFLLRGWFTDWRGIYWFVLILHPSVKTGRDQCSGSIKWSSSSALIKIVTATLCHRS